MLPPGTATAAPLRCRTNRSSLAENPSLAPLAALTIAFFPHASPSRAAVPQSGYRSPAPATTHTRESTAQFMPVRLSSGAAMGIFIQVPLTRRR
ncbi:hypothetical protein Gbem_4074 [Citrifermentans bemidjiense Bem]|uniref:Uncharacterized protein n=1 Tax=Citrifermentans bemidjiense (strain ATCC BAA-1014 / DSM 16622 / JCM 12645 / Bem) TaxID=404380 RepID=E1P678_CITBB|nr:hypothetical protein Gbem_4074 [Citrifermentans bemidjiense Bem]